MPDLNEFTEITVYPNGFIGLSFKNNINTSEIVFEKDYLIWVRNTNSGVESGKYLKSKYTNFFVLAEVLKIFN